MYWKYLIISALILNNITLCIGQNIIKPEIIKEYTPTPSSSNLGRYGISSQVAKSTGSINEVLELFTAKSGDLRYAPEIQYSTNGLNIDDWGGRLGMNWTDNFTAVITRVVKSVPDEMASSNVKFLTPQQMSPQTQDNLSKIISLTNAGAMGGADGEYDLFNFNVFGVSGQFIIHDGVPKLLNHQEKIKIEILGNNPWKFLITKSDGFKYYFGLNDEREVSTYSNENMCDIDAHLGMFINTAWYLSKIVSPKKDEINFNYINIQSEYIYDTNNFVQYNHYAGSDNDSFKANNAYKEETQTFCVRTKRATIPTLTSVQSRHFEINFDYIDRIDLPGDKLISKIRLKDANNDLIKTVNFTYYSFTTSLPIEPLLSQQISASPFINQIKTRYFLSKLSIGEQNTEAVDYHFEYYSPELLPHRFSFSKDIAGYYNAKNNSNLMPKYLLDRYKGGVFKDNNIYLSANRTINPDVCNYGLLKKVVYPTKGYNEIVYEPNSFTILEPQFLSPNDISGTVYAPENTFGEWYHYEGEFFIPQKQKVVLDIWPDYLDPQLPAGHEFDDYLIRISIVNFDTGQEIQLPTSNNQFDNIVIKQIFNRYYGEFDIEEGYYGIKVYVSNKRMYFNYSFKYFQDVQMVNVDKPFYGNRVFDIKSYDGNNNLLEKRGFNYKNTSTVGTSIVFSDTTSIVKQTEVPSMFVMDRMVETQHQVGLPGGGTSNIFVTYPSYVFYSNSIYPMDVYGGSPYLYRSVTEFYDDKLFNTSCYEEASNEMMSYIHEAISGAGIGYGSTNVGWRNGIEKERILGGKVDNAYQIKQKTRHFYSQGSNHIYANYLAKKGFEPQYIPSTLDGKYELYSLIYIPLHSVWFKLDSTTAYNYEGALGPIINTVKFNYNMNSELLNAIRTTNSFGLSSEIYKYGPSDMVENFLDPTGVYQAMVNTFNTSPTIIERKISADKIVSETRSNYSYENDMFLEKSKQMVYESNVFGQKHDFHYNEMGRLLYYKSENGVTSCLLWGYEGNQIIAVLDNCSYNELISLLGSNSISDLYHDTSFTTTDAIALSEILRLSLPNAQIATYSYKPLVGMTSMTDAKGMTVYYEYDGFGRLKGEKDHNGKVLKTYGYHYRGQ